MDNYFHNFRTGTYDYISEIADLPAHRLKDYMIQDPMLHDLFDILLAQGESPLDAYKDCLKTSLDAIGNGGLR